MRIRRRATPLFYVRHAIPNNDGSGILGLLRSIIAYVCTVPSGRWSTHASGSAAKGSGFITNSKRSLGEPLWANTPTSIFLVGQQLIDIDGAVSNRCRINETAVR